MFENPSTVLARQGSSGLSATSSGIPEGGRRMPARAAAAGASGGLRLPNDGPPPMPMPKPAHFPPLFVACLMEPENSARRQFEHRSVAEGDVWEPYTDTQNAAIARAVHQDPNGRVELPGLQVEVRFGDSAVSGRMVASPPSGMIQVTTANDVARVVRPVEAGPGGGNEEIRKGTPRSLRQLLADGAPPNTVLQNRRLKVSLDGVPQPRGTFGCCATGGSVDADLPRGLRRRAGPQGLREKASKILAAPGTTAAHWAAAHGNLDALEILEAAGANLAATTSTTGGRRGHSVGEACLAGFLAGWHGQHCDTFLFAARNAERLGFSIAHAVAEQGNVGQLTFLLDEGVPVDLESSSWSARAGEGTLMHAATAGKQLETLSLLTARGADLEPHSASLLKLAGGQAELTKFIEDKVYEQACARQRNEAADAARAMGLTPNDELWTCPLNRRDPASMDARSAAQRDDRDIVVPEEAYDNTCQQWLSTGGASSGEAIEPPPPPPAVWEFEEQRTGIKTGKTETVTRAGKKGKGKKQVTRTLDRSKNKGKPNVKGTADKWIAFENPELVFKLEQNYLTKTPFQHTVPAGQPKKYAWSSTDVRGACGTQTELREENWTRRIRRVEQPQTKFPPRSCLRCGVALGGPGAAGATEVMLLPCNHSSLCETCGQQFSAAASAATPSNPKPCPLCGTPAEGLVRDVSHDGQLDAAMAVQVLKIVPQELWANAATLLTLSTSEAAKQVMLPGKAGFQARSMNAARSALQSSTAVSTNKAVGGSAPEPEPEALMPLTFSDITGNEIHITAGQNDTIAYVKKKVEDQTGMEPDEQLLLLGDPPAQTILEVESQTLAECGISSGSKLMIQAQDPAQAAARRAQREASGVSGASDTESKVGSFLSLGGATTEPTFNQSTLLRVVAEEVARGAEKRVDDASLGDSLVEYAPLLVFMLGGSDGHWRDDKGFALCRFLGAPLVDRTETIDFKLKVKSLYPIPQRDPSFNMTLSQVMMQRAEQIMRDHTGEIDVLWSGGIDTTAAVVALLQVPGAKERIRIRYCERSVTEYPRFFREHISTMRHELIKGHVRDAFDGVRPVVTGDPADMLLGTFVMAGAFKKHWLRTPDGRRIRNPLFMGLDKPWEEVIPEMLHRRGLLLNRGEEEGTSELRKKAAGDVVAEAKKEWIEFLRAHAAKAPIPIVTTFDWMWWMCALPRNSSVVALFDTVPLCAARIRASTSTT